MALIVLGVLLGFALLVWLAVEVRKLTDATRVPPTLADIERATLLLRALAVIMSVSLAGVAVWIGHFACRPAHDTCTCDASCAARRRNASRPSASCSRYCCLRLAARWCRWCGSCSNGSGSAAAEGRD
jgi:hypothetical protein